MGAALRFHGLFANTFHADEALFAWWARLIAVWRDPLLMTQAVDKPPLLFYLQAAFYPLLGAVEWAARMPSFAGSLLLIPLTAQLARRLTGDYLAAILAAVLVTLAPLTIQFSATAFSDPLLTFWLMAALYAAAMPARKIKTWRAGPLPAGLFFGLALATKYQALLFVPLLIGIAWQYGWRRAEWSRAAMGVAAVLLALFLWQSVRAGAVGLVGLQWANIGGIRPARSWELWPRLQETARLWELALGRPILIIGSAVSISLVVLRRGVSRFCAADVLLLLFSLGYTLLHWLWAVPAWDRYLLPLLPLVAILIGRSLSLLWTAADRRLSPRFTSGLVVALIILATLPTATAARRGAFPIGGGPAADGGAAVVARLLEDAPYGTVLYDHWYSWQWRYQLFDERVYVSWFQHADALLADLEAFAGSGPDRYIALPASEAARPIMRRLLESGYRLEPLGEQDDTTSMVLYRIDMGSMTE